MSLFEGFYNTPAMLREYQGMASNGKALYSPGQIEIRCRFDGEVKEILDNNGEKVTSTGKIQSVSEIKALDIITVTTNEFQGEFTIISSMPCFDVFGSFDHWEARI